MTVGALPKRTVSGTGAATAGPDKVDLFGLWSARLRIYADISRCLLRIGTPCGPFSTLADGEHCVDDRGRDIRKGDRRRVRLLVLPRVGARNPA